MSLGNQLHQLLEASRKALFEQGEFAELTYGAFDLVAISLQQRADNDPITLALPVGLRPDRRVIESNREYTKEELLQRYQVLAFHHLAVNSTIRLITIVEVLLSDLIRTIVLKYPKKLGSKKQISMQILLEATSLEDMRFRATDVLLNELAYKSPKEFAEAAQDILTVNLLESPVFHKYIEIKATRDIHLHNGGFANETYVRKAGTHARVGPGTLLTIDLRYFLEAYEISLQLLEWLEESLLEKWPSSEHEDRKDQPKLPFNFEQFPIADVAAETK